MDNRTGINAILSRVKLLVGRGKLNTVSDAGNRQRLQFSSFKNETRGDVERVQNFGFTSNPLNGSDVLFVAIGGSRDHPVAIVVDDPRCRKHNLEPGESAMYNAFEHYIHIKNDGTIEVSAVKLLVKASEKVRFETPKLEVTGDIIDRVDDHGQSMSRMREVYNSHRHAENDSGGPTDPPDTSMIGDA